MSDEEVVPAALDRSADRIGRWLTTGQFGLSARTWQVLLAISLIALLSRLVGLGYRPMHFDEGRVAYWALRYAKTGHFEYRYIVHGPLIQHVDRWLFALLGANDFVARLPLALVGGLLPLSVVLYRDHLRETELVALAVLFAVNPILLYYSRFMRSDLLVAAAMFVALGFVLRLHVTREARYLHAATAAVALGFASKENAVVYLVAWAGAAALLVDTGLYRPRTGESGRSRVIGWVRGFGADRVRAKALVKHWGGHGLLTVVLFLALTLFFFAPRAGSAGGVGLWKILTRPTMVPALLEETAWDIAYGMGYWFGGAVEERCFKETLLAGYYCFLKRYVVTMLQFAGALTLLAALGFVGERYGATRARNLVMFASYWGVASVVGYPLGMDIWAAWPVMHALVPLAIPAAVTLAGLLRVAEDPLSERDAVRVGAAGLSVAVGVGYAVARPHGVLEAIENWLVVSTSSLPGGPAAQALVLVAVPTVIALGAVLRYGVTESAPVDTFEIGAAVFVVALLLGHAGGIAVEASYLDARERDSETDMVQYAQPSGDMRPGLRAMRAAVSGNEGLDVLYYGHKYYLHDESVVALPPPKDPDPEHGTGAWFDRLPLPWYTEAFDATVASVRNESQLDRLLRRSPPVIIASANEADDVAERVDGYRRYGEYDLRAHIDGPSQTTSVVIFVRDSP